ncbi:MAG: hypothetical protein ACUVX9_16705 [Anaerolineae bacterium]
MSIAQTIGLLVAVGLLLLIVAIIVDSVLTKRAAKRRFYEEHPELAPKKRDTADAFIELLGHTSRVVQDAVKSARESQGEENGNPASHPAA